ncbi:unnamed protein product [Rotaria sordida]|uniref:Ubiquitin-like domain-containing protein n=1 Tax=Rotaria sordida TaxID=392033 RepID=A0A814JC80_9BILA|nr:unnamed protein product [Rotaria sordida]CAF1295070.1 unnamed protein product [Rotaria sordida]
MLIWILKVKFSKFQYSSDLCLTNSVGNYWEYYDKTMASTSSSDNALINIIVEISSKGSEKKINLNDIPLSITVGELKKQLKVQPNARFGRLDQFESWDNRRTLSDYFVKNGESFMCVIQCTIEEGQSSFDDYNEWLLANNKPAQ